MFPCDFLHQRHEQHVVVHGQVGFFENGSQLELVGGHFVVARLAGDAQFQGLDFQVFHEFGHALGDGAEVVVVHLLVLGRFVPHQCASRHEQVRAGGIKPFVHEEVFLFPSQVRDDLLHVGVEVAAHVGGGFVHGVDGLFQRSLVVERLAGVGDENGGNHQGVAQHEYGRGRVPGRIAARFEGGADAAVGERRGVGFLLDELLARKFLHHAAFAVVLHESVVLFRRAFGQGLEPVCAMGDTQFHGPFLHAGGHGIGCLQIEQRPVVDDVAHLFINISREIFEHLLAVEHILAEELGRPFRRGGHSHRLLLESLAYDFES